LAGQWTSIARSGDHAKVPVDLLAERWIETDRLNRCLVCDSDAGI
jgi:hypothetical protein